MVKPEMMFALVLVAVLVAQALAPRFRLLIVTAGAALMCAGAALVGVASVSTVFAGVPWNVLLILVALGLFTERLAATQLFGLASVALVHLARAKPMAVLVLSVLGTYAVSSIVNNLTALMVLLPVLLTVFALSGVSQRYAVWTLGALLVACNLGGAATPIGDFPAVLLLGRGTLSFQQYLKDALPVTLLALLVLLALLAMFVKPTRDVPTSRLGQRLTLMTLSRLYRGVRLDMGLLWPCLGALTGMMVGWLALPADWGVSPELVAWLGAGMALLARPLEGESALKRAVDVESALFLLALFLMVAVVRETGLFVAIANLLISTELRYEGQVVVFLVTAAVLTGLFSAGPSMAALLEVADVLATGHLAAPVYIGLALAVCAGSSLFLTAATAGPLMQNLVDRAGLRDFQGEQLRFGFREFLPVGLMGFALILSFAVGRTLWVIAGF
jgi:Na+/H+ antiporter NhaD/arsenite permease-like protein